MFAEERRDKILMLLKEHKRVIAKDLAERFQVSIDSIRRDLSMMEEQGLLKRTHGGAVPVSKVRTQPQTPSVRYGEVDEYQNAVAKAAVSYIDAGDTVHIGGAALHYAMLKYLPADIPFTVVTNSLNIAGNLKDRANIETYIVCGKLKPSGNITDALALDFLKQLKIDTAFLVGGGLTAKRGMSTTTPEGAAFGRAVAEVSRKVICLSNYYKIGAEYFATVVPLQAIDTVITDWESPKDELEKIEKQGVKVVIAAADN